MSSNQPCSKATAPTPSTVTVGRWLRGGISALAAVTIVAAGLAAAPAQAEEMPAAPAASLPETVSADVLPTPQINGVVWSTAVRGDIAFAVGSFTHARPYGVALGGPGEVLRNNAMAFNISTGEILPWNPNLNAQGRDVEISPDGSQVFVGGDFTTVGGQPKSKIAAFTASTLALDPAFDTSVTGTVLAIDITADTVYIGGSFQGVEDELRSNLAAFDRSTGSLKNWAPTTDDIVHGVLASSDNTRVVVGGRFQNLNDETRIGIGAVDGVTGDTGAWSSTPIPGTIGNSTSWVTNMIEKDGVVYASANGMGGHWFDGRFAADFATGELVWLDNCYGASTDVAVMGEIMYSVSHAHDCSSLGEFPEETPQIWRRALAETIYATGTDQAAPSNNSTYSGQPVPSLLHWYPSVNSGFFTNQYQGGWALANNDTYLVMGGEFTRVNGESQQGLATYGKRAIAPNDIRPIYTESLRPSVVSLSSGTARVAWGTTWDYDDENLTYEVLRDYSLTPVATLEQDSNWWQDKQIGIVDTGLAQGANHTYRIRVSDPWGNSYIGPRSAPVTISSTTPNEYGTMIVDDGASSYWPLNENAGSVVYDNAQFNDADARDGVSRGAEGAVVGDSASSFNGREDGHFVSRELKPAPDTFTTEAWFKTSTNKGGRIIGFANNRDEMSTSYDRHVWMDNSGRLLFGVWVGSAATLGTSESYNDGEWHQVTSSMGPDGMVLYMDGLRVGYRTDVTAGQVYSGYWRVGGDNLNGWPENPNSYNFDGTIDEVAVYPEVLDRQTVLRHYEASGRTADVADPPSDEYGLSVYGDNPDLYWRLDETSGTTAADQSLSANHGVIGGDVTLGARGALENGNGSAATFDGSGEMVAAATPQTNPRTYSMEAWFKTASNSGGKIIGFGNSNTGLSTQYDRHVYMRDDGSLTFGTYTGQENVITTASSYNDDQWHQVVATQAGDGMRLYVDGVLAGTNPQVNAESYTGYWRIGGDRTWGGASGPWFNGSIDEAAVYGLALTPEQVSEHFTLNGMPNTNPEAAFEANPDGLNVTLNGGTSIDPDGEIVTWKWKFGDGDTAEGENVQHLYATPGVFTVTLTVEDNRGGAATVAKELEVAAPNQEPIASFTSTVEGRSVKFDAAASADLDGSISEYAWDFGDGTTGTGAGPQHAYSADGVYAITLTVTDDDGAAAVSGTEVSVANQAPSASFTSTVENLKAVFDATTSADSDGEIVRYEWNFGDGGTANGSQTEHQYANEGTYDVVLTVGDIDGAKESVTQQVNVSAPNAVPASVFSSEAAGLTVAVDGTRSLDPDGTIVTYTWDFGDGSTATGATASHTYAVEGEYSISLSVTDNGAATHMSTAQVTVAQADAKIPTAVFSSEVTGLAAAFEAGESSAGTGTIDAYAWNFGDGNTAAGVSISHEYEAAGQYEVALTVTNSAGESNTLIQQVTVEPPGAVGTFTSSTSGLQAYFDASASSSVAGEIVEYVWQFGDGSSGSGVTAEHVYAADGQFTVTLTVEDELGATSTAEQNIIVSNATPAAAFSSSIDGLKAVFDGSSSTDPDGELVSYEWDFGDGASGAGESPEHSYSHPGEYEVVLTVTDGGGLTDARTQRISVTDPDVGAEPQIFAQDAFERSLTGGFGEADLGGLWDLRGSPTNFSVTDGTGRIRMNGPGAGPSAYLNSVASTSTEVQVTLGNDKAATGGGIYNSIVVRGVLGEGDYRAKVRFRSNGDVAVDLLKIVGSVQTSLSSETVISGLNYEPGDKLRVRLQATGTSPTQLKLKVWEAGTSEPAQWQLSATDSTPQLQLPGRIGLMSYLSGSATNAPVVSQWNDLLVREGENQ